jgi:glycosyltransferase involved in cell wall biosynthesis
MNLGVDPRITVAICTHDRAQSLGPMLETLLAQRPAGCEWELLLVENGCTDGTVTVARGFEGILPLRITSEPELGLSHARNRALREARGEAILFTDDDVRLDAGWLAAYRTGLDRFPEADFFAGRIVAETSADSPPWFREETRGLFDGILVQYEVDGGDRILQASDPPPIGASFAVRRRLVERNGVFRADLGVRGRQNGRGEETEYFFRAREADAVGAYLASAVCHHPVDWSRFRLARLFEHGVASGIAYQKIQAPESRGSRIRMTTQLLRGVVQAARGRGDRFRRCVVNCGMEAGIRRAARGEA